MQYTIGKDGSSLERRFWCRYFKKRFPNYEVFWQQFVVPLTCRPHSRNLCKNIDPKQEQVAMAHYSVFHHLAGAYQFLKKVDIGVPRDSNTLYPPVLFHMAAAVDRVYELCLAILILRNRLDLSEHKMDEEGVIKKAKKYFREHYDRDFRTGWVDKHKPIAVRLHYREKALQHLKLDEAKDFLDVSNPIRELRNIVAHRPYALFMPGTSQIPKRKKLEDYRLRTDILYKRDEDDFEEMDVQLWRYLDQLTEAINTLWPLFISWMGDDPERNSDS
jgi:hypothetical protein